MASGDTVAWEIKPRGNILYLKAREENPPTNLQVATMRADGTTRTYSRITSYNVCYTKLLRDSSSDWDVFGGADTPNAHVFQ